MSTGLVIELYRSRYYHSAPCFRGSLPILADPRAGVAGRERIIRLVDRLRGKQRESDECEKRELFHGYSILSLRCDSNSGNRLYVPERLSGVSLKDFLKVER